MAAILEDAGYKPKASCTPEPKAPEPKAPEPDNSEPSSPPPAMVGTRHFALVCEVLHLLRGQKPSGRHLIIWGRLISRRWLERSDAPVVALIRRIPEGGDARAYPRAPSAAGGPSGRD
jgi:hypothetical protein